MPPHLAATRVLLQQIDTDDRTFSLLPWSEQGVPEPLARSIARVGVLHPPLLKAKAAGGYRVIAGRRRLQAVREKLQGGSCLCLVLAAEAADLDGLALGLEETLARRSPSPVEKAFFLQKVCRHLGRAQVAATYFPLLGLAPDVDLREQWALLALEEPLLQALHAGRLTEEAARDLGGLAFSDRLALFEVIELLGIPGDEQLAFLRACRQAALQESRSILHLLATAWATDILEDPATGPSEKTAALRDWLDKRQGPPLERDKGA